jgi:hypothetical protein
MSEQQTQSLQAPESCRSCGARLASDQRYCLNCGQRRGDPRIDFRAHLPGPPAATNGAVSASPEPPAVVPPTAQKPQPQRDYTPLAAVGGIAVLGLMLLVGVLIGQGSSPSTSTAPQVIVPAEVGGDSATASEEGTGGDAAAATKVAKAAGKAKVKGKKADDASSLLNSKGGGPVVASDEALQELEEGSGASYSENSAKLPDEIATGGAPPPKDNKAPGGGSKGTAIE